MDPADPLDVDALLEEIRALPPSDGAALAVQTATQYSNPVIPGYRTGARCAVTAILSLAFYAVATVPDDDACAGAVWKHIQTHYVRSLIGDERADFAPSSVPLPQQLEGQRRALRSLPRELVVHEGVHAAYVALARVPAISTAR